jgi:hypothetical protein
LECCVGSFDTDVLGTFTGEVERQLTPVEAAVKKCQLALDVFGGDLAFANEGSFGPHPYIPFTACDDELVVLVDQLNGIQIIERHISTETNFNHSFVHSWEELEAFAEQVGFPSHRLILRINPHAALAITKGLNDWDELKERFEWLQREYKKVYAETDMRACYNPTRMSVIQMAVEKLVARTNTLCPLCSCPGFGITDYQSGLPCEWCGLPTLSVLYKKHTCVKCGFQKEVYYPKNKKHESAQFCEHCNP